MKELFEREYEIATDMLSDTLNCRECPFNSKCEGEVAICKALIQEHIKTEAEREEKVEEIASHLLCDIEETHLKQDIFSGLHTGELLDKIYQTALRKL